MFLTIFLWLYQPGIIDSTKYLPDYTVQSGISFIYYHFFCNLHHMKNFQVGFFLITHNKNHISKCGVLLLFTFKCWLLLISCRLGFFLGCGLGCCLSAYFSLGCCSGCCLGCCLLSRLLLISLWLIRLLLIWLWLIRLLLIWLSLIRLWLRLLFIK